MSDTSALQMFQLFADADPEAVRSLEARCTTHSFQRKKIIIEYMAEDRDVWFITEGTARVVFFSASGKEVSFRDIGPGEFFGEFAALDGRPRSACVIATSAMGIIRMPGDVFWETVSAQTPVMEALFRHLVGLLRDYTSRITELGALPVAGRVHAELLRLARVPHDDPESNRARIEAFPTHAELATRLGTHREAVTRELNRLIKQGIVEIDQRAATILDVEALSNLVLEGELT